MGESALSFALVSLHAGAGLSPSGSNTMLLVVLVLAGFISTVLVGLSVFGFTRRRSRSYLLITLALVALALKAFVGGLFFVQLLSSAQHHLLEHGMDFITAALLISAIYYARTVPVEQSAKQSR